MEGCGCTYVVKGVGVPMCVEVCVSVWKGVGVPMCVEGVGVPMCGRVCLCVWKLWVCLCAWKVWVCMCVDWCGYACVRGMVWVCLYDAVGMYSARSQTYQHRYLGYSILSELFKG